MLYPWPKSLPLHFSLHPKPELEAAIPLPLRKCLESDTRLYLSEKYDEPYDSGHSSEPHNATVQRNHPMAF